MLPIPYLLGRVGMGCVRRVLASIKGHPERALAFLAYIFHRVGLNIIGGRNYQ